MQKPLDTAPDKAICIFHYKGSDDRWLNDCLRSIDTDYPIMVANYSDWQLYAFWRAFERTQFDQIFFLNDTMIVKDNRVWDLVFTGLYRSLPVSFADKHQMYLGKYFREHVYNTGLWTYEVNSRREDVIYGEDQWHRQYEKVAGRIVPLDAMTDPDCTDPASYEEKYGRRNKVLDGIYFKKWKSKWNISMITD